MTFEEALEDHVHEEPEEPGKAWFVLLRYHRGAGQFLIHAHSAEAALIIARAQYERRLSKRAQRKVLPLRESAVFGPAELVHWGER